MTNIRINIEGGGNDNGFNDNTVITQETNVKVETQHPLTALARNAVK